MGDFVFRQADGVVGWVAGFEDPVVCVLGKAFDCFGAVNLETDPFKEKPKAGLGLGTGLRVDVGAVGGNGNEQDASRTENAAETVHGVAGVLKVP